MDNGSSITRSFDELWNMYQYPDRGDVASTEEITDVSINILTGDVTTTGEIIDVSINTLTGDVTTTGGRDN